MKTFWRYRQEVKARKAIVQNWVLEAGNYIQWPNAIPL